MKQQVTTGNAKSAHILSQGIISNGLIFVSGQVHCNLLPRIAVLIKVDKFPTKTLYPAGMKTHWSADGSELLRKYRF